MEIRSNNYVNFKAKVSLVDDLAKNTRLQKIAKELEAKTAKKYPEYEMILGRPEDLSQDKLSIVMNRGVNDDLTYREHTLTSKATEKFMNLSDNGIIQKLVKLLGIVKKHDNYHDNIANDIAKLESKYGVEFDQDLFERIYNITEDKVNSTNFEKISKDSVLSDYENSFNIFK